uniref:IS1634 family transposase n=1 Tax=Aquisalimonas sp. TaxID=1872621 RepID=UPI0025BE3ABC
THTQIAALAERPGIGWLSALRSEKVRALAHEGALQLSLFDEHNLAEIHSPAFPGERLIACYNPLLAEERRRKREALLAASEAALEKIRAEVARRTKTPLSAAAIGAKAERALSRHKMAKHFELTIADGHFDYGRREARIEQEAALDGIYVIRTSEPRERLSAEQAVRGYKNLAQVERAFRTLKGLDLRIRPIHHRDEARVRAHIFLCLLAYYVEWHLRRAWAPLLFDDEELAEARARRDPVAPAAPTAAAQEKKTKRRGDANTPPIHSFATLMAELATRCRHRCRLKSDPDSPVIVQDTESTPLQRRALELIQAFPVS